MTQIESLVKLAHSFEDTCIQSLLKIAKIKKLPNGKYQVVSQKGKNLGTYKSKGAAEKRLKQVEFFKHLDKAQADDTKVIDLTKADEFSYSAIMRKLRQEASKEEVIEFLKLFKSQFDRAIKGKINSPDKVALQNAILKFHKLYPIKLDKKMVKSAAVTELGNAEQVGKYLSDIVKFILNRLPVEKRVGATDTLRNKFLNINENEISSKSLPDASAYGQAITFVKHVLFNHDPHYVREVLNSLARYL